MRRCRRESHPARAHLVEVTVPTAAAHRSGLVETKGLTSDVAQRKIDRLAFRAEVVAIHDAPAELVIDVDVCARHTPIIHLDGRLSKAPPPEVRLLRRSIDLPTLGHLTERGCADTERCRRLSGSANIEWPSSGRRCATSTILLSRVRRSPASKTPRFRHGEGRQGTPRPTPTSRVCPPREHRTVRASCRRDRRQSMWPKSPAA